MLQDLGLDSMNESSLPTHIERERDTITNASSHSCPILLRCVTWCTTAVWRTCVDWRTKRPFLTRATAHLSIIGLALITIVLSGVGIPAPRAAVGGLLSADVAPSVKPGSSTALEVEPPPTPSLSTAWPHPSTADIVARMPVPHTTFPERPRSEVITYTVIPGDTVFGIAQMFELAPETIYWANSETLHDNPHLLPIGVVLNILPVNGIYHTVQEGDTVESVAEKYNVEPEALYNEWNDLEEGQPLVAGQKLVIPGGSREFIVWQPPRYSPTRRGSGACPGPFIGVAGRGWFNWPTSSRRISGWVFHDPRNPPHSGLDIGLRTGDPVYAADNGVVVYRGWAGGYGNLIILDHGNGYQTYYAHLSEFWVGCGASVWAGGAIAAGGSTGWSTGPHLHFEIRYEGIPQNPQAYLP